MALPESWDGDHLCRWLSGRGISLCPGGPFFWFDPDMGRGFVRIALMREEAYFADAAVRLRELLQEYDAGPAERAGDPADVIAPVP